MSILGNGIYVGGATETITTENLTAANIKKGVRVRVGTAAEPAKYANVTGTYEGYALENHDIFYKGQWADGWSASDFIFLGKSSSAGSCVPFGTFISGDSIVIKPNTTSNSYANFAGIMACTKAISIGNDITGINIQFQSEATSTASALLGVSSVQPTSSGNTFIRYSGDPGTCLAAAEYISGTDVHSLTEHYYHETDYTDELTNIYINSMSYVFTGYFYIGFFDSTSSTHYPLAIKRIKLY